MRSKQKSKRHYCAVTLLTRPPSPTVLVGPAHCTYLCKSSRGEVDNCCCGGPNDCSENISRCGNILKVVELTGEDAEVICGEWETGYVSPDQSGENTISFLILEKSSAILTAMSMLTHLPTSKMTLLLSKWMTVFYHQCKIDGELILLVSQLEDHHQWVTTQAGQTEYHITS